MESRFKERLIGAAVLVALAVWLIPWVLDGPANTSEDERIALQLPAAEESAPVRTETIELNPSTVAARPARNDAEVAPTTENKLPTAAAAPGERAEPTVTPAASATAKRAPTTASPPQPSQPAAAGEWFVQLGSFGDAANAQRLASRVNTYGYDARVSDYRAGGRTMHRVRVGPQATREQAAAIASSISAHGFVAQVATAD